MEYAKFPLRKTWVSQGMYGSYSHKDLKAIDFGWLTDYPNETKLYAPFTGKVVHLGTKAYGNGVILESTNKVKYADGTEDYMCLITWHDNDISDLKLNQVIKQDEKYSDMGVAGGATGTHCHLEVVKGKYKGYSGTTANGSLKFINSYEPHKALFLTEDTELRNPTYEWKILPKPMQYYGTPVNRNESVDQVEANSDILRVRETPNGNVLGYINKGLYNVLNSQKNGDYTWYEVEENRWIAYSEEWAIFYSKKVEEPPITDTPSEGENNPVEEQEQEEDKTAEDEENVEEDKPNETTEDNTNIFVKIFKLIIKMLKEIFGGKK